MALDSKDNVMAVEHSFGFILMSLMFEVKIDQKYNWYCVKILLI